MRDWQYEWTDKKNRDNLEKHGISLEAATAIFDDPMVYEYHDEKHSGLSEYGVWEDRYIAIGWINKVMYVVYTVRWREGKEICRMISARKAEKREQELYEKWCKQF